MSRIIESIQLNDRQEAALIKWVDEIGAKIGYRPHTNSLSWVKWRGMLSAIVIEDETLYIRYLDKYGHGDDLRASLDIEHYSGYPDGCTCEDCEAAERDSMQAGLEEEKAMHS